MFINPLFGGDLDVDNAVQDDVQVEFSGGTINGALAPPIVLSIEDGGVGNMVRHTDQCGHSETDRVGEEDESLTIEGIVTLPQANTLKRQYTSGNALFVTSPTASDTFEISDLTLTLEDESNRIEYERDGQEVSEQAVRFQFQFSATSTG